jgi:predicted DNA-binding antitoxin AbrB/MazE fold protein
MSTVEAIYENGVFTPVGPIDLPDRQRVRLQVEPVRTPDPDYVAKALAWSEEARALRDELQAKYGLFPDSTELIREDRYRDD